MSAFVDRFLDASHAACAEQFPRTCNGCKRTYASFAQFVGETKKIGQPKLDSDDEDENAIGMLCFANCRCNGTMALRYEDLKSHRAFNAALRTEARASNRSEVDVMRELVDAVDARATIEQRPAGNSQKNAAQLDVGAAMVDLVARSRMSIPPIPAVALKIEQLTRDPDVGIDAVIDAVSCDAALAAAVVQLANSALYRRGQAATSLPLAISRVGLHEVRRIAMAMGFGAAAAQKGPLGPMRLQLWNRSLLIAHLARLLAPGRNVDADEAFLCGLLHPMGAIVGTLSVDSYLAGHATFPVRPMHWWMRLLEMFRVELGALTATQWKLPPVLTAALSRDNADAAPASALGVMQSAVEAAGVAEWTSALTAQTFSICATLSEHECFLVANEMPQVLEWVAAFEASLQGPPQPSRIAREEHETTSCATQLHVLSKTSRVRYRVCAFSPKVIVLEGPASLTENLVAHLQVEDATPPLSFWATPRSNQACEAGWRITLTPFAVDAGTFARWTLLVSQADT